MRTGLWIATAVAGLGAAAAALVLAPELLRRSEAQGSRPGRAARRRRRAS